MIIDKIGIDEINTVLLYIQREIKSISERTANAETKIAKIEKAIESIPSTNNEESDNV